MSSVKMPLPTRRRALQLGAGFIENDLDEMRRVAQARFEQVEGMKCEPLPVTHSHEYDIMKAAEWAYAAATLRAMAGTEEEPDA